MSLISLKLKLMLFLLVHSKHWFEHLASLTGSLIDYSYYVDGLKLLDKGLIDINASYFDFVLLQNNYYLSYFFNLTKWQTA